MILVAILVVLYSLVTVMFGWASLLSVMAILCILAEWIDTEQIPPRKDIFILTISVVCITIFIILIKLLL